MPASDSAAPPTNELHPYARVADLLTAALLAVALWLTVIGVSRAPGFGRGFGPPSASVVVYAAVSLQIVRHLLWPKPAAWSRFNAVRAQVMSHADRAAAIRAFVGT